MLRLENRAFGESAKTIKFGSSKVTHRMEQHGDNWMVDCSRLTPEARELFVE